MRWLRRWVCGLRGHDALLHFEDGRMSMQCTSCGYETPGWDLRAPEPSAPPVTTPRFVRLPLVGVRRTS